MYSSPEVISNRVEHELEVSSTGLLRREFGFNVVIFQDKLTDYPFMSHEQAMPASE
jgi:hypothetical protein